MKIILLDIDGVLAPLGKVANEFITIDLDGWSTIAIPNDNVQLLKDINKKVNIVWSSSWENTSNNICMNLNINHFDYLKINNDYHKYWNKIPAMIKFIENNPKKRILIVDEDSKNILCTYDNVTILEIKPTIGLSTNDKVYVHEWINALNL